MTAPKTARSAICARAREARLDRGDDDGERARDRHEPAVVELRAIARQADDERRERGDRERHGSGDAARERDADALADGDRGIHARKATL